MNPGDHRHPVLGIFTGVVNGVSNLVVNIHGRNSIGMITAGTGKYWSFSIENNDFVIIESEASGWSAGVISGAGLDGWQTYSSQIVNSLTRDDITYRVVPV